MAGWPRRSSGNHPVDTVLDRAPLLRATDVAKSYAGVQALRGASLELFAGEVHALVGENGAGKSTLIKILTGAVQPDGGEILIEGLPVTRHSPRAAKALGIAAIYQRHDYFEEMREALVLWEAEIAQLLSS